MKQDCWRPNVPNPVTQGVLLQELFGEVLQVAFREWDVGRNGDLRVSWRHRIRPEEYYDNLNVRTVTGDLHIVAELSSLALDLDAIVQELLEVCTVKDAICSRLREVDDEFVLDSRSFSGGSLDLLGDRKKPV